MIEWYRAGAGTVELMEDTIELIGAAANAIGVARLRQGRLVVVVTF